MRFLGVVLVVLAHVATATSMAVEQMPIEDLMAISRLLSDVPLHVMGELPMPMGMVPVGAMSMGAMPMGAMPMGAMPMGERSRPTIVRLIVRRRNRNLRHGAQAVLPRPTCPCAEPIQRLCKAESESARGPFAVAECLQKNAESVPEQCSTMLADTMVGACAKDAESRCASVPLRGSEMHECLAAHVSELSQGCKAYFEKSVKVWPRPDATEKPSEVGEAQVAAKVAEIHHTVQRKPSVAVKATEAKATEAKATEAKATEAKVTEAKATEAKVTEAKATEAKATEAKATEAKATKAQPGPHAAAAHIFKKPVVVAGMAVAVVAVIALVGIVVARRVQAARTEEEQAANYRLMMT